MYSNYFLFGLEACFFEDEVVLRFATFFLLVASVAILGFGLFEGGFCGSDLLPATGDFEAGCGIGVLASFFGLVGGYG